MLVNGIGCLGEAFIGVAIGTIRISSVAFKLSLMIVLMAIGAQFVFDGFGVATFMAILCNPDLYVSQEAGNSFLNDRNR